MRVFTWCFLLICCLGYSQLLVAQQTDQNANQGNPAVEGKRVALVIGNGGYTQLQKLTTPINDAQDMTAALIRLGFFVILVQDADFNQMNEAIGEFVNKLDKNTEALFYFSGHGGQNTHSESLLYPIDMPIISSIQTKEEFETFEVELEKKAAITLKKLLLKMKEKESPTNIIILDACRENTGEVPSQTNAGIQKVKVEMGLGAGDNLDDIKQRRLSDGFLIAYATAPGGTSAGWNPQTDRRNSLYTHFLLKNLFYPGAGYVVFEKTRQDIVDDLKNNLPEKEELKYQVPWENNSLRQTFYFIPRKLYVHGGFQ